LRAPGLPPGAGGGRWRRGRLRLPQRRHVDRVLDAAPGVGERALRGAGPPERARAARGAAAAAGAQRGGGEPPADREARGCADMIETETAPFYAPVGREVDLFEASARRGLPIMLKGPTGCGKTRRGEFMA